MNLPIRLLRQAAIDLDQACAWYEVELSGLGEQFLDEFRKSLLIIAESPFSGTPISKNLRRSLIHRFQYAVIYEPGIHELIIVRVVHCASKMHSDFVN